jgi:RHS repeat-associated protein
LDDETDYYYYGARYYNPRTSLWLGTDPLSGYNPLMEVEHYIDGQHNGGVYNSGNLNPYIYCYQSPIVYYDPNGKQVHSSQRPKFSYDSGFSMFQKQKPTNLDYLNYSKWVSKATVATPFMSDRVNAYKHYLGNTGKHYTFNLAKYINDDASGQRLLSDIKSIAMINAQKVLKKEGNISYYSEGFQAAGNGDFPYPDSENWQKAIGAFNVYYKADLSAKANKNGSLTYTLNLTIYGEDKYNFNPGQSDIATGTSDNENGRFEVIGWAKEFMQSGAAKVKPITWTPLKP